MMLFCISNLNSRFEDISYDTWVENVSPTETRVTKPGMRRQHYHSGKQGRLTATLEQKK